MGAFDQKQGETLGPLRFQCTICGRCCHGLRLSLSLDEALVWAEAGHALQILTEAMPWPEDPTGEQREYDLGRSFPARSGAVPFRVAATIVAYHAGACPYLLPDMRCGNYATRPRICRIYPLHSRPFQAMAPSQRLCPTDAWGADGSLLIDEHGDLAVEHRALVQEHRGQLREDVGRMQALCAHLQIATAAFAHEGLAVHQPDTATILAALRLILHQAPDHVPIERWTLLSNRHSTLSMLADAGCSILAMARGEAYLGSFDDDL